MPTARSRLRVVKMIIILAVAIFLLSKETVIKALLSLLVALHITICFTHEHLQTAITQYGPNVLNTAVEKTTNYYESVLGFFIQVADGMMVGAVDFMMFWFRASPRYLCSLNARLLRIGPVFLDQVSEDLKDMLELDWSEAKESVQRFCEFVEA